MTIVIDVPGDPVAQPRAKASTVRNGAGALVIKNGRPVIRMYTSNTAEKWKRRIHVLAMQKRPREVHTGAVRVDIKVYFARPQRLLKASSPAGPIPHIVTPDKDNLEKAVLDAIKGAGIWKDDCQVYAGELQKYYVAKGFDPGARIEITLIEEIAN